MTTTMPCVSPGISPELRDLIDHTRWHQASVVAAAALLPADDEELDQWIEQAIAESDMWAFMYIVSGALTENRRLDARHLARGTALVPNHHYLGTIAWGMEGEVTAQLLVAVRETTFHQEAEAMALLAAAAWWREYREGPPPLELSGETRLLARKKGLRSTTLTLLQGVASITNDASLLEVIRVHLPNCTDADIREKARVLAEAAISLFRSPMLDLVPERPTDNLACDGTMRRSVARIGRNESCPCGSGRKYKRCCFDKDQERLHLSTDVAGKTAAEVRAEPERHLTMARLEKAHSYDVARYDPVKIPRELLEQYFLRLGVFSLFDRAAEAFEKLGCEGDLRAVWDCVMFFVARAGRKDIAERMMKIRGDAGETVVENLRPGARLLLVRDDPAATLRLLEELARAALETTDSETLERIASGIMDSPLHALGILIARSVIPITEKREAVFLFNQILENRDRLALSPDDPFADILEKRYTDEVADAGKDAEQLRAARARLEEKAEEVRRLNEALAQARREIERREKAPVPAPAAVAAPMDEEALRELRGKVARLKSTLHERHQERSELRGELEKAHADLETLRASRVPAAPNVAERESGRAEDDLLLPGDVGGNQPLRTIEFPRKFSETLAEVPRQVARGALALLGRIAGGEPAAFAGVVRLKALPDTVRARIGIDHRLLFRLLPDRVQVVDLIPRQDLDRRIKTLE